MNANKTRQTGKAVTDFIDAIEHDGKREDAKALDAMFRRVTGEKPAMWGPNMIGYGQYHYKYDSGREGDWMRTGFSPQKAKHSLHLMGGLLRRYGGRRTRRTARSAGQAQDRQ